jgi:hypothetical protein
MLSRVCHAPIPGYSPYSVVSTPGLVAPTKHALLGCGKQGIGTVRMLGPKEFSNETGPNEDD